MPRSEKPEMKIFLSVGSGKNNIILYIMMYTESVVTHRHTYQDTKQKGYITVGLDCAKFTFTQPLLRL